MVNFDETSFTPSGDFADSKGSRVMSASNNIIFIPSAQLLYSSGKSLLVVIFADGPSVLLSAVIIEVSWHYLTESVNNKFQSSCNTLEVSLENDTSSCE